MTDEQLDQLIAADDLGLTKPKPKRTPQSTEEERLFEGFQEIVRFVETTGAAPVELGAGMNERLLFTRMNAIRKNPTQCVRLLPFDEYGLLKSELPEPVCEPKISVTIGDILDDTFLDELQKGVPDIFTIKHIPLAKDIEAPDHVAQRQKCKEFKSFEARFTECQAQIKAGHRELIPFAQEQQIEAGKFYVLRGILLFVERVGERVVKNNKSNARLRCIFENGTESDMLLRSLSRELYKDGRRVTEVLGGGINGMVLTEDDNATGHIYVLRSLSGHADIRAIPNLHKIGLTRGDIMGRIKNAANEPTYLMSNVALVASYECYNLNLAKLENLLHKFFDASAAKIQVRDGDGYYHTPKEWFSIPLETIDRAVRLLISGDIVHFRHNHKTGLIEQIKA